MQRLRGHLEKNWELRIEYLKYQIHVVIELYQISWLPFAYLSKTNPHFLSILMTSDAVIDGSRVMHLY
jgi:hypothetical protein